MEFNFNVNDVFKESIAEIGSDLLPPKFRGDRRTLRETVTKVAEVINAMGEASAMAQGLPRTITTAEKLRNSNDQKIHLLLDEKANNGNGAVIGMLKTGHKGLYLFDRSGNNYQISPPCVLDFYIHEKYQRKGLGKELFQHMLQRKAIQPDQMALDRPSEKFLKFLNKHYSLETPMKQMNNYVVFDGFFRQTGGENVPEKKCVLITKGSANGLQNAPSPYDKGATQKPQAMTENPASSEANQPAGEQFFANTQSPQYPMQNQTVSQSDPGIPYHGVQSDHTANPNLQYQENAQNYVQQTTRSEPQVCYQPQGMTDYNQIGSETQNNYQLPTSQASQNPNSDLYMYIYLPNQTLSKQDLSHNAQNQIPGTYQPQPTQNQFQANELNANQYNQQYIAPQTISQDDGNGAGQNYTPQIAYNTNYQNQYQPTPETTTNPQQQATYYENQYVNPVQPQQPNEAQYQQQSPYQIQNMPREVRSQQLSNPASNVHILIKQPSNTQIQAQPTVVAYQAPNQPQPVSYQQSVPYVGQSQHGLPQAAQPLTPQQSMSYHGPDQPIQSQSQTYQTPNQQPSTYQMGNQQPSTYQMGNQQPSVQQAGAYHIPSQQLAVQQTQSQPNQDLPSQDQQPTSSHQIQAQHPQTNQNQQASYRTQSQPVLSNRPQGQPAAPYRTPSRHQVASQENVPNPMANQAVSQTAMRVSQRDVRSAQHGSNPAAGDWSVQDGARSMDKIIEDKLQQFGYPPQAVPFKPRVLHRAEYCP